MKGTVVVEGKNEIPMDDIVEKFIKVKAYPFFKTNTLCDMGCGSRICNV